VAQADEVEYKVGINGLLRGGIAVSACGFLFLVALMISRGLITMRVQFIGELALCLGLIGVGFWKRDEKEDFGQLMVGLGSFGLYASVAGAHVYKHLYEAEALVVLYTLLSLGNLAYAAWRASKSFLTIGLLGGLAAAMLPMQKMQVPTALGLHFLILIPCAAIVLRNRWYGMALLTCALSTVALLPATMSNYDQLVRVGALYGNAAIAALICGKLFTPSEMDRNAAVQPTILFLSGLLAIGVDQGHKGSLHALVLAAIGLVIGHLLRSDRVVRDATWVGSLIVLTVLAPIGFTRDIAAFLYGGEALVLTVVVLRTRLAPVAGVALTTLTLAFASYLVNVNTGDGVVVTIPVASEHLLIGLLGVTVFLQMLYARQAGSRMQADGAVFTGTSILAGLFARTAVLSLSTSASVLSADKSVTLSLALMSLMSLVIALRLRSAGLSIASSIFGLITVAGALLMEPTAQPEWHHVAMLLISAVISALGVLHVSRDWDRNTAPVYFAMGGVVISGAFGRLMQMAGAHQVMGLDEASMIMASLVVLNLVWTGIATWRNNGPNVVVASSLVCFVGLLGITYESPLPIGIRTLMAVIPMLTLIVLYVKAPVGEQGQGFWSTLCMGVWWALLTSLFKLHLVPTGMSPVAAATVSWVTLAFMLIVAGFKFHRRYLRYGSLFLFGVTVGKVFMVDLAELDSLVRVSLLMVLGVVMVGGGYWYILWRRGHQPPAPPTTS